VKSVISPPEFQSLRSAWPTGCSFIFPARSYNPNVSFEQIPSPPRDLLGDGERASPEMVQTEEKVTGSFKSKSLPGCTAVLRLSNGRKPFWIIQYRGGEAERHNVSSTHRERPAPGVLLRSHIYRVQLIGVMDKCSGGEGVACGGGVQSTTLFHRVGTMNIHSPLREHPWTSQSGQKALKA